MILNPFKSNFNSIVAKKFGKKFLVDPRAILDEASRASNEPIEATLNFVSKKINIPICKIIPDISLSNLPSDIHMHIFWEKGFSPIMFGNEIVGIASSNPTLLKDLPKSLRNLPIFLSSWALISNSLYNAEKLHKKASCESDHKLAIAILGVILEEAKKCEASKVLLQLINNEVQYQLEILQKNSAVGKIAKDGSNAILSYLSNLNSNEIEMSNNGINEKFKIKRIDLGFEIYLSKTNKPSNIFEFPAAKINPKTPTVFLVDDDKSFLIVTERYLMQNGIVAKSFLSSNSCLEALQSEKFDPFLIITDMHMQDSTGVEFINKLKLNPQTANTPIIGLSGDENGETELSLLESGAEYVVMKRGDPRILLHLIKRFMKTNNHCEALP